MRSSGDIITPHPTMSPRLSIAHYQIVSKLGEGGMGEVWRATDIKLNREVAIKILPDVFARDSDRLVRFNREAQLLASLNHPNIAAIYGAEERALVLELVEGFTLAGRIAQGPLSPAEALPLIEQLIDALEYAHDKSIVHRDLKPANIMVTPEGRLKVLDFGLARALSFDAAPTDPANSPTVTMRETRAGVIIGTAGYMSPEQARGHNADRRADIWAFGVIVYEMLRGSPLFTGSTVSDTLAAVLTRDPDFSSVPVEFHRLLHLCLVRDTRQRLSHISTARVLLKEPAPVQVAARRRSRGAWFVAIAVSAVLAAGSFGIAWYSTLPVERPAMRFRMDLGPDFLPGLQNSVAVSPDGMRIVFLTRGTDGKPQLATRRLDQPEASLLAGTENAAQPFFSPDSQWIGFFADQHLKKIPVQGGAVVTLCDASPNPRGASWNEDGSIIAAMEIATGLSKVPAAGGAPQALTKPADRGQVTHRWPQALPGGETVLFTAHISTTGLDGAEIDALSLKTGHWKTVQRGGFFGRYVASGHLVYVHQGTLYGVAFDPERLETKGQPIPILEDVAANETNADGRFQFSSASSGHGILAYMGGKVQTLTYPLVWLDATGKARPVLPSPLFCRTPALSPDGRFLALAVGSTAVDVRIWDIRREVLSSLTSNGQDNSYPVWAPDSRHIVYRSALNGNYILWWARADGGGQPLKLLESRAPLFPTSFSPDGRRLAYNQARPESGEDLFTMPLDTSDPENPRPGATEVFLSTPAVEVSPVISPDGRWMAYTARETALYEVYVRPFKGIGGRWQISSGGGSVPRWSNSGRQLFFVGHDGRVMVVDCETSGDTFAAQRPRPWSPIQVAPTANIRPTFDITSDGKQIVALLNSEDGGGQNGAVYTSILINFFDELRRRMPTGRVR